VGSLTGTAAGTRPRARAGFTLVELLVVLVVLAVAAGLIVAALDRDPRRSAAAEARRLAAALEHAAALSQWTGQTLGVSASGATYRFWRRGSDGGWAGIADDDVLAPRRLPDALTVGVVSYAGAAVAADAILPLRQSGRNEPYVLMIAGEGTATLLASDALNRVAVTETDRR
jgi:type II secretion system protein H